MEREYKIDNLRAIAILLVVLGHSIIIYDPNWGLITSDTECLPFFYLKQMINLIQMPLFFSISGYCFCLSKNQSFGKNLLLGKFKRILIPYFIVCILYMNPIKILLGVPGYELSLNMFARQVLLFTNNGHLWYLPSLFLMFIVTSIGIMGGRNRKMMFLIAIILSVVSNRVPSVFSLSQFSQYYVYFIFGYIICFYRSKICINKKVAFLLCLIPMGLSLVMSNGGLIKHSLFVMMALCCCLGFYIIMPLGKKMIYYRLSRDSYGIYLFHSPLIYFMYMLYPNVNPIIMFTMNFIVCGFISLGFVYLVRSLGLKFIIGEK